MKVPVENVQMEYKANKYPTPHYAHARWMHAHHSETYLETHSAIANQHHKKKRCAVDKRTVERYLESFGEQHPGWAVHKYNRIASAHRHRPLLGDVHHSI